MSTPEKSTPESSSTAKDGKRHRRAHRKSRYGCLECKQRKIKCDETIPVCLNCIKRDVPCSSPSAPVNHPNPPASGRYASDHPLQSRGHYRRGLRFVPSSYSSNTRSSSDTGSRFELRPSPPRQAMSDLQIMCDHLGPPRSPPRIINPSGPSPVLSYADLELWHHYVLLTTGTVQEWADGPEGHYWRVKLPEMGFQHEHILHLLLGLGALHKSRVCPTRRTALLEQANCHNVLGMRGATAMLTTIDEKNFQAAYASTILISLFSLGVGPRQGEYIGFSDNNDGGFLTFLRGVRCINELQPVRESDDSETENDKQEQQGPAKPPVEDTSYRGHVRYLRSIATAITGPWDADSADVYLEALESLEPFLSTAFEKSKPGSSPTTDAHSNVPFAWLYRLSDSFLNRLQRKVPLAIAIFACWAVALGELETSWITKGWPEHIVSSMWDFLDVDHKELVRWPMNHMGLRPINVAPILSTKLAS